ncbi:hypothetical protein CSB20_03145 [bacterium DOLZORAL124_64_63]|nr:MAG: hypothetical protein CSB20_03145 [bacterium DOLZORAL124_64_63]
MIQHKYLRSVTSLLAMVGMLLLLTLNLTACSDSSTTPDEEPNATAPTLPAVERLTFDLSFFSDSSPAGKASGEHEHFLNAVLRAGVLGTVGAVILTPPVSAFSLALSETPVAEGDGSWVWSYTWTFGEEEVTVVLRGLPDGEQVMWTLGLREGDATEVTEWFYGPTTNNGQAGTWSLRDMNDPEHPVVGEVSWGLLENGVFLQLMGLAENNHGDILRFERHDSLSAIDYTRYEGNTEIHLRWDDDGSGSLTTPDYNGGEPACWDADLVDTVCP